MWGPMGVNHRFHRRVLRVVPATWVVLRVVLMVLTCLSMKPFDLR